MKLIFAVIQDRDSESTVYNLTEHRIGVTKLSSTGGFLRRGSTTLMIGVEEDQVGTVMEILQKSCAKRMEQSIAPPCVGEGGLPMWSYAYTPIKVEVGGATVFVLDVADFQKL